MCPYFRVGHILAKKKKSPQSPLDRCWAFFSWGCWNKLRPYNFSVSRMFWVPLIFLAAYYFLQCHYQFDWGFLCPEGIWNETCKTFIPGLPTMIPTGMSKEQEEAYLCKSLLFISTFFFVLA